MNERLGGGGGSSSSFIGVRFNKGASFPRRRGFRQGRSAASAGEPRPCVHTRADPCAPRCARVGALRRSLALTDEHVIERLDEETLEEKVERVVDVAARFLADPRDVSPTEVTEAKALLVSMRHHEHALAPIPHLRVDWRGPLLPDSDIPPAPRSLE